MRKTATTNICIAFFLKNISDNDKCHINTQKANYFNTSWTECHFHILTAFLSPRPTWDGVWKAIFHILSIKKY